MVSKVGVGLEVGPLLLLIIGDISVLTDCESNLRTGESVSVRL